MTLLEAVNLALRSTGETGVSAINSSHPKVATILAEIDTVSQRLQRRGWWFNTGERVLEPETTGPDAGKIDTSAYDFVVPWQRGQAYFSQGGFLVDQRDGSFVGHAVKVQARWSYPTTENDWLNMPDSFTDYVAAEAALSFAANYDADALQIRKLGSALLAAKTAANMDHTRFSRLNLFAAGSTGVALNSIRNRRYRQGSY